jgi:hypothetical protein
MSHSNEMERPPPLDRPKRPGLVKVLAPFLGISGLGGVGLGIFFFVAPFFFAAKDGGFNIAYFVGSLLFFGLFGVLFLVLGGALVLAGFQLWDGDDEGARSIGWIGGGLFGTLLAMGFANQPSIGPEDVSAIVALSVPTILLLGSAWLVGLPHVQRYVDDCDRVNALERERAERAEEAAEAAPEPLSPGHEAPGG